ncbi:hypothetical protein [Elizabethkingia miricola]|uniref:hypothetical protein n=1 Tax=Elizabethkingia miricola TaxID=172045 RepID=UPI003891559F
MNIEKIIIDDYSFYLEDYGDNKGKVIVTGWDKDENYSYYWSAMGMDLKSFLKKTNNGYFIGKLMLREQQEIFSSKNTGRNIRKIWKEEIMKWYEHQPFQKDFREKLNSFLDNIIDQNHFVYEFDHFIDSLDFYLIDDRYERERIESDIKDILQSECWHLIETEISPIYKKLSKAFDKLKKKL